MNNHAEHTLQNRQKYAIVLAVCPTRLPPFVSPKCRFGTEKLPDLGPAIATTSQEAPW